MIVRAIPAQVIVIGAAALAAMTLAIVKRLSGDTREPDWALPAFAAIRRLGLARTVGFVVTLRDRRDRLRAASRASRLLLGEPATAGPRPHRIADRPTSRSRAVAAMRLTSALR